MLGESSPAGFLDRAALRRACTPSVPASVVFDASQAVRVRDAGDHDVHVGHHRAAEGLPVDPRGDRAHRRRDQRPLLADRGGRLVGSAADVPPQLDPAADGGAPRRLALRDDGRLRGRRCRQADRRGARHVHVRHVPDPEPGAARPPRLQERRPLIRARSSTRWRRRTCSARSRRRSRTRVQVSPTAAPSSAGSSPRTTRTRRPSSAPTTCGAAVSGHRGAHRRPRHRARPAAPASVGEIVARGFGMFEGYHNDPERTARGDRARRLVPHRRHRQRRRGRPHRLPRPHEGHAQGRRRERRRARGRVVPLPASGRPARAGRRHPRRAARRGAGRVRRGRARARA